MRGRKLHLIGVGGVGMSALALIAHDLGATVSGSDREASTYTDRLQAVGVMICVGHDAANLPPDAEVVISTAIGEANPELARARENGQRVMHRSDLLAEFVGRKPVRIAVAGAHGKTTTTAMIAHVLTELGADPAFFVGGEVCVAGRVTNAHWGAGEVVVVEADESDGSFLKLKPTIAIVNNIELDHHVTWSGGLSELYAAFAKFAAPATTLIAWRGQPGLSALSDPTRTVGFAIGEQSRRDQRDLIAENVSSPEDPAAGSEFMIGKLAVKLGVPGEHNVLNALASLSALRAAGFDLEASAAKLASFAGVGRRFELIGESAQGARVYDDYAHHPTEVHAALKTARGAASDGRVVAVFQPHLFSRTRALAREFGRALALADVIVVLGIYPSRELATDFPGVSGWMVATATADAARGARVYYEPGSADALEVLRRELRSGDLCMTIGAGDVYELAYELTGRTVR